jgi:Ca2+-binding EF-hand superfamily protein
MPNPIITALDANSDGTIDEAELKNATAALKKLDKDGDGKLSQEETRPAGMGGRGGPGGPGGPGQGGGGDFVATFMQNDKNGDGKIAKDELSERAQGMFGRLDTNSDGFIDKKELETMAAQMRERGGQGGGRPPGEGGARPEGNRPQRPPAE